MLFRSYLKYWLIVLKKVSQFKHCNIHLTTTSYYNSKIYVLIKDNMCCLFSPLVPGVIGCEMKKKKGETYH